MKFERTASFERDFKHLDVEHQNIARDVARTFSAACDDFAADPGCAWPAALRVSPLRGHPGIWEMTWSFSGPDGRATFEWISIDDKLAVRWRRIGSHDIFETP